MRDDILFIRPSVCNDFIYHALEREGYCVEPPYRGTSLVTRILREFSFKFDVPKRMFWYNRKVVSKDYPAIVVFDATITLEYLQWLRECHPHSRIILYYLNPVSRTINPDTVSHTLCEKWSSDFIDCENRSDLHWDSKGFYFASYRKPKSEILYDVLYIGRNKGRKEQLLQLKREFLSQGLTAFYYIVADHRYQAFGTPTHKRALSYADIVDFNSHTRSILSLSKSGQTWLTMRVFESLFNEIKLITDNDLLQKCEFYHPDNIYIIGQENRHIADFLNKPYHSIDEALIAQYDISNWVERMFPSK